MLKIAVRYVTFVIVLGLVAVSCGGQDEFSDPGGATGPVTSDDGILTLEARRADAEMTIRTLSTDEVPEGLAGLDLGLPVYELGPEGAEFSEPVTLTFRIPSESRDNELPYYILGTSDGSDEWEPLADQTIALDGDTVVVSGTTTHFSTATAFGGAVTLTLTPDSVTAAVEEEFQVAVSINTSLTSGVKGIKIPQLGARPADKAILMFIARDVGNTLRLRCLSAGSTAFDVVADLREVFELIESDHYDSPAGELVDTIRKLFIEPVRSTATLPGSATCTAAEEADRFLIKPNRFTFTFTEPTGNCGIDNFTVPLMVTANNGRLKFQQSPNQTAEGPIDPNGRFIVKGTTDSHREVYRGKANAKGTALDGKWLFKDLNSGCRQTMTFHGEV